MHSRTARFKGAVIGVCADDVGSVLPSYKMLRPMSRVFYAAENLARLVLNTAKCKTIPLAEAASPTVEDRIRAKITELVPRWCDMTVTDRA
eukprot:7574255-Pyramimonas_sp.AAC.1